MNSRRMCGLAVFWLPLLFGYLASRAGCFGRSGARRLISIVVVGMAPTIYALAFWVLPWSGWRLAALPLLGVAAAAATLLPAMVYARRRRLNPDHRACFLNAAFFSNLGYLGAMLAFVFFGEEGYSLAVMYMLLFGLCFFTMGFSIAAGASAPRPAGGSASDGSGGPAGRLARAPAWLRYFPLAGIVLGLWLNLAGVRRPLALGAVNTWLVPLTTAGYLFAVGGTLRIGRTRAHLADSLVLSAVKFVYTPCVALALAWLLGCHRWGHPWWDVVALQASMPVGVMTLILPPLFDLDADYANSLWLVTTVVSLLWLPVVLGVLG